MFQDLQASNLVNHENLVNPVRSWRCCNRIDESFQGLKISKIENFNRRVAVAPGPRQTDVQHAVTNKIRTVSASIRCADLHRNVLRARYMKNSIQLSRRRDGRVVEPANHCAATERRVRESSCFDGRVRRNKRINTVDSFYCRTILPRERHRAFEPRLFAHGPRKDNFPFQSRRHDPSRGKHQRRRSGSIVERTRSEASRSQTSRTLECRHRQNQS